MKILHLTLKKKWFDMVLSGIKKEEYREVKPYWNRRLFKCTIGSTPKRYYGDCQEIVNGKVVNTFPCYGCDHSEICLYDAVQFRNGYQKGAQNVLVELCRINTGVGKKEWGAPEHPVYILSLGKIIK